MKHAIKNLKHRPLQPRPGEKKPTVPAGPNWLLLGVVTLFTGALTFLLCEYVLIPKLPSAMLGKWVIVTQDTDPENVGLTMDFYCNGSVVTRHPQSPEEIPGTARVIGDKLEHTIIAKSGRTKDAIKVTYLIATLNDKNMELEFLHCSDGSHQNGMRLERPSDKR